MKKSYSDGFFDVSEQYGFLPCKEPLALLPDRYRDIQDIINNLYKLIKNIDKLNLTINNLRVYDIEKETNIFIIQALFRAYAFISSAYLLCPAFHNQKNGIYGKALNVLPRNLALPLVTAATKLQIHPWLEYHYAYSLGNYVKIDPKQNLHWQNLKMACSFTNTQDEIGFIMNHVYINEKSPDLIKAINMYFADQEFSGIKLFYKTLIEINNRRQTMWQASRHKHYNDFRVFIMGIKGNTEIFGPGVQYQIGDDYDNEYRQYRGQTGAQDDIIPTCDIFTDVIASYPENQLTEYLLDLRKYRPQCVQDFFADLTSEIKQKPIHDYFEKNNHNGLVYLLASIDQIYLFRNGHWQFVQKYIMANTKYAIATGGTPIISWLPNQIEACLHKMTRLIKTIDISLLNENELKIFQDISNNIKNKIKLLDEQLAELRKENFDAERIYQFNIEEKLEDRKS